MKHFVTGLSGFVAATIATAAMAAEGPVPTGVHHLDHVFVIMMENHTYQQVIGNPAMPFINGQIAKHQVNLATNYFAVGHPSLTNYLEIVGGSNFGVRSDNSPDWHNHSCQPNLASGVVNADNAGGTAPYAIESGAVCPISGVGTDAPTEAVDSWNEVAPPIFNFLANVDGVQSVPAATHTVGKSIGDQLARVGLHWKSYQESLPVEGADRINSSNGTATNQTTYDPNAPLSPTNLPPLKSSGLVAAYAAKHNPFVYFQSVQEGWNPENSLHNVVGFDGPRGLYADLASGHVPALAFIAPNQCDDQHGRGNSDAFCAYDQGTAAFQGLTDGTQVGLNPGLAAQADTTVNKLVASITKSPIWEQGYNAIVIVWDENDYSGLANALPAKTAFPAQNQNLVVLTVQTNSAEKNSSSPTSGTFYNSYSLLKTLEAGFKLPCLNHACDADVKVMGDLFVSANHGHR